MSVVRGRKTQLAEHRAARDALAAELDAVLTKRRALTASAGDGPSMAGTASSAADGAADTTTTTNPQQQQEDHGASQQQQRQRRRCRSESHAPTQHDGDADVDTPADGSGQPHRRPLLQEATAAIAAAAQQLASVKAAAAQRQATAAAARDACRAEVARLSADMDAIATAHAAREAALEQLQLAASTRACPTCGRCLSAAAQLSGTAEA